MTWTAKPVDPEETCFLDVNILREDGLAVGVAVQNGNISPEEALQNANKMAAGPDLLVALKAILHTYDDGGVPLGRAFQMANRAIVKAEGHS